MTRDQLFDLRRDIRRRLEYDQYETRPLSNAVYNPTHVAQVCPSQTLLRRTLVLLEELL